MIRVHRVALDGRTEKLLKGRHRLLTEASDDVRVDRARELWRSAGTMRAAVRARLEEMAPGLERCMYCGDNQGSDIDHFEPIARNPLRTFDWLNHLLACSICNSRHKREQYPRDEQGSPLLIDPSVQDPFDHLLLTLALGEYRALSDQGEATIEVCGLNRTVLTLGRMRARPVVGDLLRRWREASASENERAAERALASLREQPFADVVQSMLRQAVGPGADIVLGDEPDVLAALRDERLRTALLV